MSKYHAKRTQAVDGTVCDSRKEARRLNELILLERAGKISNLRCQVDYELVPPQYEVYERASKTGKRLQDGRKLVERSVMYRADFVYDEDGRTVVEDVKGLRTREYIIKRKLMRYILGIKIKEV